MSTQEDVTKYSANLHLKISLGLNAIKYLEDIKSGKIQFPNELVKSNIATIIVEWLVVTMSSLFDQNSDSISFQKLIKHNTNIPDSKKAIYKTEMEAILKDNQILISRLKNNRDLAIAHTGKEQKLGYDLNTVDKIVAGGVYGRDLFHIVKDEEFEFLTPSNFPIEESKSLLKRLNGNLFYNINYPDVKQIEF